MIHQYHHPNLHPKIEARATLGRAKVEWGTFFRAPFPIGGCGSFLAPSSGPERDNHPMV